MGYILKKGGSGGGGDATAFNQIAQINQIQSIQVDDNNQSAFLDSYSKSTFNDGASGKSVFKWETGSDAGKSVFIDENGFSSFNQESRQSVFKNAQAKSTFNTENGKSILEQSNIVGTASTNCISFQNATPSLLASDIQSFLQTTVCAIISIVYADAGGLAPNPHTALIIYNTI